MSSGITEWEANEIRREIDMFGQGEVWKNDNDGFVGLKIGTYRTIEGEEGLVLQQIGTRVCHLYRLKWLRRVHQNKAVNQD